MPPTRTVDTPVPDAPGHPGREGNPDEELFFRVSSGLKRIIGRDLITNEFVAIFELVKNSFDAGAGRVEIAFVEDRVYVVDDGKGMSRSDIDEKWLFVAYSAKRDGTEDDQEEADYRDKIGAPRAYAGNKGVGRFSCDRLGSKLRLQSRTQNEAPVEVIEVDWDRFEEDDKEEFVAVPVHYETAADFELPRTVEAPTTGTALEIWDLRQGWTRDKLLSLKSALSKLINPFGASSDDFLITITAPGEEEADREAIQEASDEDDGPVRTVNGPVENFIFETLSERTTHLLVQVSDDGASLESRLVDRGETIYEIREPNPYPALADSEFSCHLFYLNKSAKATFTRRIGVQPVRFGSVFLFRNGFRVYPVGEEGDDSFQIDRRKQQSYARYLGTRDLIGRIDVTGSEDLFKEATSRDQGLIRTSAYVQLEECFREKCLKRLERYVVDVTWLQKADKDREDISLLLGDRTSARVTDLVARLADTEDIELLNYSPNLVRILDEKAADFETSLSALKIVADKVQDTELSREIKLAEERYQEMKRAEQEARETAERERAARQAAEARAEQAEAAKGAAESAYEEEKKRSLFLASMTTADADTVINLHHQIGIYSAEIQQNVANQLDRIRHGETLSQDDLVTVFERIAFKNQQVLAVSRFATRANFRLDSENIEADLVDFVVEYLDEVYPVYADRVDIHVENEARGLVRKFKPIEVTMVLDNLVSNARKAGASEVSFRLTQRSPSEIEVIVTDDGAGFDVSELERVFEKGFTTTSGSGLGLYYARFILDQMGGSIAADPDYALGARLVLRIPK